MKLPSPLIIESERSSVIKRQDISAYLFVLKDCERVSSGHRMPLMGSKIHSARLVTLFSLLTQILRLDLIPSAKSCWFFYGSSQGDSHEFIHILGTRDPREIYQSTVHRAKKSMISSWFSVGSLEYSNCSIRISLPRKTFLSLLDTTKRTSGHLTTTFGTPFITMTGPDCFAHTYFNARNSNKLCCTWSCIMYMCKTLILMYIA